jgi:signal transduction histidine kinase
LLASLGGAGVLAWDAYSEANSRRSVAENVLKAYASLAAEEAARRTSTEIGFYGYQQVLAFLALEAQKQGGIDANTCAKIVSSSDAEVRRASGLVRGVVWRDGHSGELRLDDAPAPTELIAKFKETTDAGYRIVHLSIARADRAFAIIQDHGNRFGFEVNLEALPSWLQTALSRRPLLPTVLAKGQVTNASLYVSIRDDAGSELFRLGHRYSPDLSVRKPFSEISQRALNGAVEVSIDPSVAGLLIIGGLPKSHLPALLGMLAITTGLIAAAILQLRREMALQALRGEFVSSVSHELRTPLTQIRMFAETLRLDRVRSAGEARRSLDIIDREARRLSHLVENVLRFSRSERGMNELTCESRELAPLIAEVITSFEWVIAGTEVTLKAHLAEGVSAMVDADGIRQVLLNLLDNAVKYGPRRQQVLLKLEAAEGAARIGIEDEGPGIPPADRERIFERFQRLDRDRKSSIAGTGIGLSVVKDVVTRHGGHCFVENTAAGGARFLVVLPALNLSR